LTHFISTLDEVLALKRLYRAIRARRAVEPSGLVATWTNIAFSSQGTAKLAPTEAKKLVDSSFQGDLYQQSETLGDPTDPNSPGNKGKWRGWPRQSGRYPIDDCQRLADTLRSEVALPWSTRLGFVRLKTGITQAGLNILYEEEGATLEGKLSRHEHFGFKDGVSQPGIRGRVSTGPEDFLTPRFFDSADPRAKLFSRPGQPLVWLGQFILGYPRQDDQDLMPRDPDSAYPAWARMEVSLPAVRACFPSGTRPCFLPVRENLNAGPI
jgi:hypothetical protein